ILGITDDVGKRISAGRSEYRSTEPGGSTRRRRRPSPSPGRPKARRPPTGVMERLGGGEGAETSKSKFAKRTWNVRLNQPARNTGCGSRRAKPDPSRSHNQWSALDETEY